MSSFSNIVGLSALNAVHQNGLDLQKAIQRLATGLRINSAADDPAGLQISEGLRSQVMALSQAIRNNTESINLTRPAEGALNEVQNLLISMRSTALHAAGVVSTDSAAAAADQQVLAQAIDSLSNVAEKTKFGTTKLLDGTIGTTYNSTNPSIVTGAYGTASQVAAGSATLQVTQVASKALSTGTMQYLGTGSTVAAGTVIVNGTSIGTFTSSSTVSDVITAINAKSGSTGVVATLSSGTCGYIVLQQTDYGSKKKVEYADSAAIFASSGATNFTSVGLDAQGIITFAGGATLQLNSGAGLKLQSAGGTLSVGLTASATAHTYGGALTITQGEASLQIGPNAGDTSSLQIDSVAPDALGTTAAAGGVAAIDVTTAEGAQTALEVLDEAISQISQLRARLGSYEKNTLQAQINVLSSEEINLQSTLSSIRDADLAAEMLNFTRAQILAQSSAAMLTQGNVLESALIRLLQH
jgi:flagellin